MKNFQTLKFLDLFRKLFESFGINYPVMRKILTVKLTMDGRRTPTIFNQQGKKKKKPEENGFIKSLGMYVILSVMLIPLVIFGVNYLYQMSIFFGIVMFLVMTSMISDFSNVLLDVRDKGILLTKPVKKKTLNAAKTIHICIYLFFLTGALTIAPVVIGTFRHGVLFLLLSIIGLILVNFFIVVLTAIIYYFILRFFDGEKLKDIINYVQIGLSVSIAVGYQVLGRAFSIVDMNISFSPSWWQFFIPPIWFGAPFELILKHHYDSYLIVFSLLALIIPIISIVIYSRMMPAFERNLQKLANNSGGSNRKEQKWKSWLVRIICRKNEERVFFRFANNMMRKEREFRLKVYPSLGLALVLPFVFLFNQIQVNSYAHLVASKSFLVIYSCSLMIPNAIAMLKYSGKYKGAWIYKTAPIQSLAPLYSAAIKVFIVNLFLPVYFILSVIFLSIFGLEIIEDLLVVFFTAVLYTVICSNDLKGTLPFSESFEDARQSGGAKIILAFLLMAVFAGIHFAATFIPFGVTIYLTLIVVSTIFAWRLAYKSWWDFSKG
jgi:ABC-2 type transport system permease protein